MKKYLFLIFILTACGGHDGGNNPSPTTECHTVGGETVCTDTAK